MNSAVEYLSQSGTFFLATSEDDQPQLRPFGAVAEIDGKAYLCTNNTKNVYKQLLKNPKIQIVGMLKDYQWVRVTGKAVFDHRRETKAAFLDLVPGVKSMYQPDDKDFEVFYIDDPITEIASFQSKGCILKRV